MESKHTPGPWKVSPSVGKDAERYVLREGPYPSTQRVAVVRPAITRADEEALGYPWSSRRENADANAALIAAAPDMLEALREIGERFPYGTDDKELDRIIGAAIAKAEGGAS